MLSTRTLATEYLGTDGNITSYKGKKCKNWSITEARDRSCGMAFIAPIFVTAQLKENLRLRAQFQVSVARGSPFTDSKACNELERQRCECDCCHTLQGMKCASNTAF